jgi:signal transduction histidine kinase
MLEQANRDLRTLDKLKSEFLANIGHELRTPLNSIIGFTELILQGYSGSINTDQRRQLAMVLSSGNRLLRVLNDVIEVSMLNADQIELKREAIPISTIINDVIREVRNSATKKKLTIFMDIEEALPDCYCSREKVKLILYNLLDNAIKFSSSGSIVISAHSTSDLSQYGFCEEYNYATPGNDTLKKNYLVVSVKDQGIGIHRDDFDILFDEFRQVDGSLTREYDGTGLGLAISKKLIELHSGNIWLDSQIGVGTTFYFSLPLSKKSELK